MIDELIIALYVIYSSLYNPNSPASVWYHADSNYNQMQCVAVR
jgi:hypothetical protein